MDKEKHYAFTVHGRVLEMQNGSFTLEPLGKPGTRIPSCSHGATKDNEAPVITVTTQHPIRKRRYCTLCLMDHLDVVIGSIK